VNCPPFCPSVGGNTCGDQSAGETVTVVLPTGRSAGSCAFILAGIRMAEQSKQPKFLLVRSAKRKVRLRHSSRRSSVADEHGRRGLICRLRTPMACVAPAGQGPGYQVTGALRRHHPGPSGAAPRPPPNLCDWRPRHSRGSGAMAYRPACRREARRLEF